MDSICRKIAGAITVLLLLAGMVGAVPTEQWQKIFGVGEKESKEGNSVLQTLDGGYVFAGRTKLYSENNWDILMVKTDENGNLQWNKTFGGLRDDIANMILQTRDGGYIIAGSTDSTGEGSDDGYLIKTDEEGNLEWDKTIGETKFDSFRSIQETSDEGYILAGGTTSYADYLGDAWLVKTDNKGTLKWSKTFGGNDNDFAYSAQQTSDGGYIIAGGTDSYGAGNNEIWLIKTDKSGNEQWNKTFGGKGSDRGHSFQQTSDGGYVLAGEINFPESDFWMIKTDKDGNELWNRKFGGTGMDVANSVQQTFDGGYVLAGVKNDKDCWLIKTDKDGKEQWNKLFKVHMETENQTIYSSYSIANSVQQTKDNGYILAGTAALLGIGYNAWLIKVSGEPDGTASPNKTMAAVQAKTSAIKPPAKEAGFEVFMAITTLLFVVIFRRKSSK